MYKYTQMKGERYMNANFSFETHGICLSHKTDIQPPDSLVRTHCHETYEILFVASGEGRYVVEGSSYPITPGTIMVIRPFQYHCVLLRTDIPYERFVINFSDAHLVNDAKELIGGLMQSEDASGRFYPAGTLADGVISTFERFETALSLPTAERSVYVKMLLSELIVLLSVSGGEQMANDETELGARVIKYLNENIDRNISLDKLAKRFFVSKYYLCRAFKKHNGISVHGYINRKRVAYAKQLIESGETASGAAYRVGFGDYSAFYRAYVKIEGKAPTAD